MGLIFDALSYAFVFLIFMITVHLYFAIPVFLYKWFSVLFDRIGPKLEEESIPVTIQPPVVKKEETKSNRWDWQEYRRHRHDTSFVDAAMWLSMGDD